jgi:hypothetical protein
MNTLELKDLKNYLGNGLKILDKVSGNVFVLDYSKHIPTCIKEILGFKKEDFKENRTSLFEVVNDKLLLPIFHPLTDLTRPCLEGGKIPIMELAKISFPKSNSIKLKEDGYVIIDPLGNYDFSFKNGSFECVWLRYSPRVSFCNVPNQIQLFEQLYSWHFWLGDQTYFEKGIIVDINSLNQEK